jgi:hypothetical protein
MTTEARLPDGRRVATDRDESDMCDRLTPGCCVNHDDDDADHESCETW